MDRRINLNANDVDALRRLVANIDSGPKAGMAGQAVVVEVFQSSELIRLAQKIARARRNRTRQFKPSMFGEPAWDMLLVLYANESETRLPVGRLAALSGSRPTTAIRWLDYLSREGFVFRRPNLRDARSEIIELTEKGRSVLEQYLSETLQLLR